MRMQIYVTLYDGHTSTEYPPGPANTQWVGSWERWIEAPHFAPDVGESVVLHSNEDGEWHWDVKRRYLCVGPGQDAYALIELKDVICDPGHVPLPGDQSWWRYWQPMTRTPTRDVVRFIEDAGFTKHGGRRDI